MPENHLKPDAAISSRLQTYAKRLGLGDLVTDIAVQDTLPHTLDTSLTAYQKMLAAQTAHDFLRYRLSTYFHACEKDFKNPPLNRQTLLPASLGRDLNPNRVLTEHADS